MGDITDSPERPRKRMRTSQNVEVVDLTDDAPLQPTPDSDEAYARELQRQFDAENIEPPQTSASTPTLVFGTKTCEFKYIKKKSSKNLQCPLQPSSQVAFQQLIYPISY